MSVDYPNSERILAQRIREGDSNAFSEIHTLYKARLLYYGKRFLDDWSEVQDVVAEAFLALWKNRNQMESDAHIKNFLFINVRNRSINLNVSRQRQRQILEGLPVEISSDSRVFDMEMLEEELMHLIDQAVLTLPKECRRIFELSWDEEKSPGEIAQMLNMNPATVRSQKRRAIQLIQDWVKKNAPSSLLAFLMVCAGHPLFEKIFIIFCTMCMFTCTIY